MTNEVHIFKQSTLVFSGTKEEVAAFLGLTIRTIYRAIDTRRICKKEFSVRSKPELNGTKKKKKLFAEQIGIRRYNRMIMARSNKREDVSHLWKIARKNYQEIQNKQNVKSLI